MDPMTPRSLSIKNEIPRIHAVARKRLHGGEDARRVVQGISDSVDALFRRLFSDDLVKVGRHLALVAVGGYGRRELCPHSDIDILFLHDGLHHCEEVIEKMVRDLWDSGLDVGHSVRTPQECTRFMKDDHITAATLLEARFLAGSESLMREFQEKVLTRFVKSHTEAFVNAKLASLRRSVEGEGRTIYVTEPHLKEGAGCLRDIQHVLWIERMRRDVKDLEDIAQHGGFSYEEVRKLQEAYSYFLRLRCELHFATGLKQDMLEHDSQVAVARNLHFGGEEADDAFALSRMMSEYYLRARDVRSFVRYYLETRSRGQRFLEKLRHRLFSFSARAESNFSIHEGHLYLGEEPELEGEALADRILEIFSLAQQGDVDLSHTSRDWIRRSLAASTHDFSRCARASKAFLWILQRGRNVARILSRMHEVGFLSRLIPEFAGLDCLVTFDGHHQFTVDEHTLRTLRELDRIETDEEHPEPEFRTVIERIRDRLPLRVALLLHDIGKAEEGDHDARGTEAAVVICERLGFEPEMIDVVEFLVFRHLEMFRYSEIMNFTDPEVIRRFANLVGSPERLDMLYLLTYIDIHSVGSGTWTSWKGAQLAELHSRTREYFETGGVPAVDIASKLASTRLDPELHAGIIEHCRLIDSRTYEVETIPQRMAAHVEMIERFREEDHPQIDHEEILGYTQVTVCGLDRPRFFADLTGLLVSEGYNILGARIHSRSDGIVLDIFQVVASDELRIDDARRIENLRAKLTRVLDGDDTVGEILKRERRRYRARDYRAPILPPKIRFFDDVAPYYTVLEVRAGDRPGLLHDLCLAIDRHGLDVRMARVSTLVDRARDVFHVTDGEGGPVKNLLRRSEIEEALLAAARGEGTPNATADRGPDGAEVISF